MTDSMQSPAPDERAEAGLLVFTAPGPLPLRQISYAATTNSEPVMASDDDNLPTLVPLVAYSTGLILGRFLVDIIADLIGAHSREGNRMSTAKTRGSLDTLPESLTYSQAEHIRRVRSKLMRGDADYEAGRTLTHEEFRARMAPWLAG